MSKVQLKVSDVEVVMTMSLEEARILRDDLAGSTRSGTYPLYDVLDAAVIEANRLVQG